MLSAPADPHRHGASSELVDLVRAVGPGGLDSVIVESVRALVGGGEPEHPTTGIVLAGTATTAADRALDLRVGSQV